jgi:hypothetical protein
VRHYYVEVRRGGTSERDLIRANGRRDAQRLAASVNREHYRTRIVTLKARRSIRESAYSA